MLRIIDARTGEPVPAAPARRGPTRVEAHAQGRDATGLRVLLVADLLVRALELGGTPVWALLTDAEERAELRADAAALGIRPFEDGRDAGAGPGRAQTVRVVREGGAATDGATVTVAAVEPAEPDGMESAGPDALRMALLARRRNVPVRLDAAVLGDARAALLRRRRAVADWARQPSRPVPDKVRDRLRAAWEDDLDTPGVLRILDEVASDPDLPDGARFEIHAYADRFLGLDLTRDLGSSA
ncbi:hypothetical protein H0H10_20320 [Streptomyces sp. TRM S81-3]|uniref:Cysteinyl-tRNA synthetase n=1 Tax=Streptomyces griseicoloratus TaxID=2752516 RepID=A0A926L7E7_9ACTN|nr:hypothetical protein [Streptomyces griseicoloratus]MBD0421473.1 hypothetical protein [Streptomyces griseicoloratus]